MTDDVIRIFNLEPIDDNIIMATSVDGESLLRFLVNIGGKAVRITSPTLGNWDEYQKRCAAIFTRFSDDVGSIEIPDDFNGLLTKESWLGWAYLAAAIMRQKSISKDIADVFFTFLKPSIDNMSSIGTSNWIMQNGPIDLFFRMFAALLVPDQMLKKNARFILQAVYLVSMGQHSMLISPQSGFSQKKEPTNSAYWQ